MSGITTIATRTIATRLILAGLFAGLLVPISGAARNLIRNSTFEIGVTHWGAVESGNNIPGPLDLYYITNGAFHGNYCIWLNNLGASAGARSPAFAHEPIILKPSTQYFLSFWAKASNSAGNNLDVVIRNCRDSRTGLSPSAYHGGTDGPQMDVNVTNNNTWGRYSTNWTTAATNTAFQIEFLQGAFGGGHVFIDAVQLEEGSLTAYAPHAEVECGVVMPLGQRAYWFSNQVVQVPVVVRNHSGESKSVTNYYVEHDWNHVTVTSGSVDQVIDAGEAVTNMITATPPKLGPYRFYTWVEGYDESIDDFNLSFLPPTLTTNAPMTNSVMGAHIGFSEHSLASCRDLGIKLMRNLSVGSSNNAIAGDFLRHSTISPSAGTYHTNYHPWLALATNYGMTIWAVMGQGAGNWAAWSLNPSEPQPGGFPFLTELTNYPHILVRAYKDYIKYWSPVNEPNNNSGYTWVNPGDVRYLTNFVKVHTNSYTWIKNADPNAIVVAFCETTENYITTANDLMTTPPAEKWDGFFDTHIYMSSPGWEGRAQGVGTNTADNFNVRMAMTESGVTAKSERKSWLWEEIYNGPLHDSAAGTKATNGSDGLARAGQIVQNFIGVMAWPRYSSYFHYDVRTTVGILDPQRHSLFDYDGTLKSRAVSFANMAQLFDHGEETIGAGRINTSTNRVLCFKMYRPSIERAFAVFWATNDVGFWRCNLKATDPDDITIYDIFGNIQPATTNIGFGHIPVIVEATGMNSNDFWSNIEFTTTNDTTAPKLVWTRFPTSTNGTDVMWRWAARDDFTMEFPVMSSSPGFITNNIQYRHKLEGYDSDFTGWTNSFTALASASNPVHVGFRARYTDLPQGNYTMRVEARDHSGNVGSLTDQFTVGLAEGESGGGGGGESPRSPTPKPRRESGARAKKS